MPAFTAIRYPEKTLRSSWNGWTLCYTSIHQPSSVSIFSPKSERIQAARRLPSAPQVAEGKQSPHNQGPCYIKLKVQKRMGTCSGVISKFTHKGRHQDMCSWVPRVILGLQACFGSPTLAPSLPERLYCEPAGPSRAIKDCQERAREHTVA